MNVTIRHEPMSDIFDKFHIEGLRTPVVIHHFKEPEPEDADPHDHPSDMDIIVLDGWYHERRYPSRKTLFRTKGNRFTVKAKDIHLIVDMSKGGCTTLMLPKEKTREPGFWRFDDSGAYFRQHNETEFKLFKES